MPQFKYVAVDKGGTRSRGTIDAPSEAEVRVILRSQQLRPVRITKAGALDYDLAMIGSRGLRVSQADLLVFSRQLSILLTSGIPLVQGLEIIAAQLPDKSLKRVTLSIKEKVSQGAYLWESMASYKGTFPDIYVSMVRAGEASGALDSIFKRLIKLLEDSERLKKLLRGAMVYPIAVISTGILVLLVMLNFVIPKFEQLLLSSGQQLPAPTKFVINLSHFVHDNFLYIIGSIVVTVYLVRKYLSTDEGKRFFDFYVLKVPLFGGIVLKVALARFARTIQTLLSSGVNLLDSMDICKAAIGNKTIEDTIEKMKSDISQGKTLSGVLAKLPIFPGMIVQMVTVGESTGNLDKMLEKIAEFYEEEVQNLVSNLTKLIEPIVLVFLGGMVGGLMIAMYLPIFKMAGGV